MLLLLGLSAGLIYVIANGPGRVLEQRSDCLPKHSDSFSQGLRRNLLPLVDSISLQGSMVGT
jgi:hypothetical protein